jgi:hypothetical protein
VTCYSDHNEDIRTKGSCDFCFGTTRDSEPLTVWLHEKEDLAQVGQRIIWTWAYEGAYDREDWDEVARLEAEEDRMFAAFRERWVAAAKRAGLSRGWDVTVAPGEPPESLGPGHELAAAMVAHDACQQVSVEIREDGTWKVEG